MSGAVRAPNPDAWLSLDTQEDILEHRACLLAKRHIDDTSAGHDTSYDVFQLAMAHADLAFWRGLQNRIQNSTCRDVLALKALSHVVSSYSEIA